MPEKRSEPQSEVSWMRRRLHDLCQPLTAMECRLVLGPMGERGAEPTPEDMRQTIHEALIECERLMTQVRLMQDRLQFGNMMEDQSG